MPDHHDECRTCGADPQRASKPGCAECRVPPKTWEEFQRAQREAFEQGAIWREVDWRAPIYDVADEARRRFPIVKQSPRYVTLHDGTRARLSAMCNLEFYVLDAGHEYATGRAMENLTADDLRKLADLLENPHEEIAA